jgi:AGCS family alanine or glycine:cation symporter
MHPILEAIDQVILAYNKYVGGYLLLFLLIPAGLYFIFKLKFLNITKFGHSIKIISGKYAGKDKGEIKPFQALTTALSGTVGTGNIVGVSLAIYYGGPGAIFWMWVTGFLGMILKYTECMLSIKYRTFHEDGSVSGGPMYYMEKGLKSKLGKHAKTMAMVFAAATAICSFGTGNIAQSNSIADVLHTNYGINTLLTGIVIAVLVLMVTIGGIKRIAQVTSKLVPFMTLIYLVSTLSIIIFFIDEIPRAIAIIFHDAFTGTAASGGFMGAAFILTLRYGVARGIFSNESGQGSAAIAFAAAKSKYPSKEGLVAMLGPFIDTIIICTLTAFTIILTGAWQSGIKGVGMTVEGFNTGLFKLGIKNTGEHIVAIGLVLFAFSTIISWSYYGSRAIDYFFGQKAIKYYLYVYGIFIVLGSIWGIELVWHFVDMVVTFMTIPNLIALFLLAPVVKKETEKYISILKHEKDKLIE